MALLNGDIPHFALSIFHFALLVFVADQVITTASRRFSSAALDIGRYYEIIRIRPFFRHRRKISRSVTFPHFGDATFGMRFFRMGTRGIYI